MGIEDRDWYREGAKQRFRNAETAKVDPDWRLKTQIPPVEEKKHRKDTFARNIIILACLGVSFGYIGMAAMEGKGEGFKYLHNISHNIRLRLIYLLSD